jgi:hypothetical protein
MDCHDVAKDPSNYLTLRQKVFLSGTFLSFCLPILFDRSPDITRINKIYYMDSGTFGASLYIDNILIKIINNEINYSATDDVIANEIIQFKNLMKLNPPDTINKYYCSLLITPTANLLKTLKDYNIVKKKKYIYSDSDKNFKLYLDSNKELKKKFKKEIKNMKLSIIFSEKNKMDSYNFFNEYLDKNVTIPHILIIRFLRDMVEALLFLYDNKLIHFDLKLANITVDYKNDDYSDIKFKLIDFGSLFNSEIKDDKPIKYHATTYFYELKNYKDIDIPSTQNASKLENNSDSFMLQIKQNYDWCTLFYIINEIMIKKDLYYFSSASNNYKKLAQQIFNIMKEIYENKFDERNFIFWIRQIRELNKKLTEELKKI